MVAKSSNEVSYYFNRSYFFWLVSRIQATSNIHKMKIEMDVNTDIYPMAVDASYKFCLATSVNADGNDQFDIIRFEN